MKVTELRNLAESLNWHIANIDNRQCKPRDGRKTSHSFINIYTIKNNSCSDFTFTGSNAKVSEYLLNLKAQLGAEAREDAFAEQDEYLK
jgi:hypothetical protein